MSAADTSGGLTLHSVTPHPLSVAIGVPSGANDESASRYRSRTGLPSGSVTRPVLRVDPDAGLGKASGRRIRDVVDRPDRPIEELVLIHGEPVGAARPEKGGPSATWELLIDPVPIHGTNPLEQGTARESLEPVLSEPDRFDREDPETENEQRKDERVARGHEEKRRRKHEQRVRERRQEPSSRRFGPAATRTGAA